MSGCSDTAVNRLASYWAEAAAWMRSMLRY